MSKEYEKNVDNVHPDILEIAQIKLEGYPFMLRQRRKADDIWASKGLSEGIVESHFRQAFPEDIDVLKTYLNTNDDSFHSGAYWSKKFMLIGVYNFLYKLCPHLNENELDVVISVDKEGKPELEIKYFDYGSNDWEDLTSIIEYQKYRVEDDDKGEEQVSLKIVAKQEEED
jgi:hypothetical protein